jgi:hypothetical protein
LRGWTAARNRTRHGLHDRNNAMRAEAEKLAESIRQSLTLLRRHL